MRSFLILSLMFAMLFQVDPFNGPVMKRNMKNVIKRLLDTKKMTRHRAVPNDFGKHPTIHSNQRRSYVYADAFGCPILPATYMFGNPILVPKTDSYGKPMTDGRTKIGRIRADRKQNTQMPRFKNRCGIQVSSITPSPNNNESPTLVPRTDTFGKPFMITEGLIKSSSINPESNNTTIFHQGTKSQLQAMVIAKTYVYIAVGTVTFLLVTAAVLLLIVWAMKRKNQRRVENAEICET